VIDGDADALVDLLAADVVAYADGGGKAQAFPKPVHGRDKVARLLLGPVGRGEGVAFSGVRFLEINGQPGALLLEDGGQPVVAVTVDVADEVVQTVRAITNPEKLRHLGSFDEPDVTTD